MKIIVVPTDFSTPSENAMIYAGQMADSIGAAVLLVHVYEIPVSMNEVPALIMPAEELKQNADAGLGKTKAVLQARFGNLEIKTESRLGDIVDELNSLCSEINPFALVIGKHSATGVERFLFGSSSLSIIRHVRFPVFVIPDSIQSFRIKNIALSVDASGIDEPHQQTVKTLAEELKAQLHLIHVQTEKNETDTDLSFKTLGAACTTIRDEEFVHGIESYIQENAIDLLVILPHKHSLMERLFFKTHTAELVQKLSIPLTCISDT
jgi:nucleotide-binding universal stress UspA family protein